jgi:hypothetical protein
MLCQLNLLSEKRQQAGPRYSGAGENASPTREASMNCFDISLTARGYAGIVGAIIVTAMLLVYTVGAS